MAYQSRFHAFSTLAILTMSSVSSQAGAAAEYHPIVPTMQGTTVTLTGHDLTIEKLIAVARYGATVQYGPGVVQRASDAWGQRIGVLEKNVEVLAQSRERIRRTAPRSSEHEYGHRDRSRGHADRGPAGRGTSGSHDDRPAEPCRSRAGWSGVGCLHSYVEVVAQRFKDWGQIASFRHSRGSLRTAVRLLSPGCAVRD